MPTRVATFAVVRVLRESGHDVTAVSEVLLGADDDVVLDLEFREGRVFLTEARISDSLFTPRHGLQPV